MKKPRIFVSHSWKYDDYNRLVNLLNVRSYFDFRESSISSGAPLSGTNATIWSGIENKIKWCQVFILIAGVSSSYSESIKREIEFANRLSKPIIALAPWGSERTSALKDYADEVVGWNASSIIQAIRRYC